MLLYKCFGLLLGSPNYKLSRVSASRLAVTTELKLQLFEIPNSTEPKDLIIIPKYVVTKSEPNQGSYPLMQAPAIKREAKSYSTDNKLTVLESSGAVVAP